MIRIDGKYTSAEVMSDHIDETSMSQIVGMVNSPGITGPVRIMPDFHAGKGSVVGFTMPIGDIVVPNIVGVDIGCGMLTASISGISKSPEEIDKIIRKTIPLGFNVNSKKSYSNHADMERFYELADKVGVDRSKLELSVGTLGGGNHFIELGYMDGTDSLYITTHSGSRNFGKVVAEFCQKKAIEFSSGAKDVVKDMEYMPSEEYLQMMYVAQQYAALNRMTMMRNMAEALDCGIRSVIDCVHNYVSPIDNIIRKGAVSAQLDDNIILPFNRAEGIWVMSGNGNADWNFSAPHGAGRQMSRGQAKRELTQETVDKEMADTGVFSSYNPVDEAPAAYKSPDEIKKYVGETAEFVFAIKPILNVKG